MSGLLVLAQAQPVGRIVGGWEYIWAAFILTWLGLLVYSASLVLRRDKSKKGTP